MSAVPAPWLSSVVATRTYAILLGLVLRRATAASPLVRPTAVLAGLHCIRPAALPTGISACATDELYGPMMKSTCASLASACTFLAPWSALWTPLTASSCWLIVTVKPGTWICFSASATPLAVGTPLGASPPVIGSSMPTFTAMLPPAAPDDVDPPQADTTMAAAAKAAPIRPSFMNSSSCVPHPR